MTALEAERLILNSDLAKRYREFGHIGINTPFYLIHIDMTNFLEPSLLSKYNKAKNFIKARKDKKEEDNGPTLVEELELMRKLSLENQRFLSDTNKIFTPEDFMYNYDEHYPQIVEDTHEASYKNILVRMTSDYDVPKFMRSRKPKTKKISADGIIAKETAVDVDEVIPAPVIVANNEVIIIKKVKGKNKKRRIGP